MEKTVKCPIDQGLIIIFALLCDVIGQDNRIPLTTNQMES